MAFSGLVAPTLATNVILPGMNFVSSLLPMGGRLGTDLGFVPNDGDQVLLWNGTGYSTNTYSTNSGWSLREPSVSVGEGFVLVTSYTNHWVQSYTACPPLFVVPANPLWTDTGIQVQSGDKVTFQATGEWNTGSGAPSCGPAGCYTCSGDPFLATSQSLGGSLIAFVGPSPYYCGTTNEWGNLNYFPQYTSANGYFPVGGAPNMTFTTDRAGELWFGINDDALYERDGDNSGAMSGIIQTNLGQ
jgi:hypothetical protein